MSTAGSSSAGGIITDRQTDKCAINFSFFFLIYEENGRSSWLSLSASERMWFLNKGAILQPKSNFNSECATQGSPSVLFLWCVIPEEISRWRTSPSFSLESAQKTVSTLEACIWQLNSIHLTKPEAWKRTTMSLFGEWSIFLRKLWWKRIGCI